MPYKNPEDLQIWRQKNRPKIRKYLRAWRAKKKVELLANKNKK